MRRRLGDRRNRPRFEIVGDLWGTLEIVLRLPLHNVGLNGALVESHTALKVDSIHRVTWARDGQETSAQVRVCHVRATRAADGEEMFLAGVEFVGRHPRLTEQLQQWIRESAGEAGLQGV